MAPGLFSGSHSACVEHSDARSVVPGWGNARTCGQPGTNTSTATACPLVADRLLLAVRDAHKGELSYECAKQHTGKW